MSTQLAFLGAGLVFVIAAGTAYVGGRRGLFHLLALVASALCAISVVIGATS